MSAVRPVCCPVLKEVFLRFTEQLEPRDIEIFRVKFWVVVVVWSGGFRFWKSVSSRSTLEIAIAKNCEADPAPFPAGVVGRDVSF